MKRYLLTVITIISVVFSYSQTSPPPEAFKYQAIVRDVGGDPQGGIDVSFQITIKESSCTGTPVYQETFSVTTNDYGLVNLSIGNGNTVSGTFSTISWGGSYHYIDVAMDINGGTDYTPMSCTQLLSVPYALYAKESGSGPPGPTGPQGLQTLIQQTVLGQNDPNCQSGGIKLDFGIDSTADGILDPNEITSTNYVCNGDPSTDNQQIDTMYIDTVNNSSTGQEELYLKVVLQNDLLLDSVRLDNAGIGHQYVDEFELELADSTFYFQLSDDLPQFEDFSAMFDNTDDQQIDSVVFDDQSNILTVYLEDGGSESVDLSYLDNSGTDDQQLSFANDILYLEDGGQVYLGFQNGVDGATGATGATGDQGIQWYTRTNRSHR